MVMLTRSAMTSSNPKLEPAAGQLVSSWERLQRTNGRYLMQQSLEVLTGGT